MEFVTKIFFIDSIGLKFDISSLIIFCEESFTSDISFEILSPVSLISFEIESLVLSIILSIDLSILFSTASEAFAPKLLASFFNELTTLAEVVA